MKPSEIPPTHYHDYFKRYINLVNETSIEKALLTGKEMALNFYQSLPEKTWNYQYAEGKWTPKEVLLHVIDTERVFSYRILRIARSENADLSGFDENLFAANSEANTRSVKSLLDEYKTVRDATLSLFNSFSKGSLSKIGKANGKPLSVSAAGYIIAGHEIHHINIIKERYV